MTSLYQKTISNFDAFAAINPFTWVYGLGRTFLAISTLITFVFSYNTVLFDQYLFGQTGFNSVLNSINYFFLFGYENLWIAKTLAIVMLLLIIIGVFPRYTGIFHWWISYSYLHAGAIVEGGDQIAAVITFLLIPVTLLDSRKSHWSAPTDNNLIKNYTARLFLLIIGFQMAVIYFHAAVEKLYKVPEWVDGTAVYYFFKDNLFGYPDWMDMLLGPVLISKAVFFITWSVIILELLLFCALFMSPKRKAVLFPFAIAFHFGIALVFGLVSFFFSMLGGLIIYLVAIDSTFNATFKARLDKLNFLSKQTS